VEAPFKCSEKCCDVIKKEPFHRYNKETGRTPITAVMADESRMRKRQYLRIGCNSFESKTNPICMPMAFWTDGDIWSYIKKYNVPYSRIYDMGEKRTGCMFCMFGVHLEKDENRFQRMKKTHPKHYDFCINKLGCGKVLDYIGVPYE
jgi:3'-phosphoadenosine 5'-phosphosulfate sulfotransferase (PAPS reductase)/FAD synthetase